MYLPHIEKTLEAAEDRGSKLDVTIVRLVVQPV
jgi:hypothetical protein